MARRKKRKGIRSDPSGPYALARKGELKEALALYANLPQDRLVRRRRCELYLLTGRRDELFELLESVSDEERGSILDALSLLVRNEPGRLRVARFRRNRGAERELLDLAMVRSQVVIPESSVSTLDEAPDSESAERSDSVAVTDAFIHRSTSVIVPSANRLVWRILPSAPLGDVDLRNVGASSKPSSKVDDHQVDRLAFLDSLGPDAWYQGSELSQAIYYVAVFGELAVADSVTYGNAIYWFRGPPDRWKAVFRRNKRDALLLGARRLIHTGDWQQRVLSIVGAAGFVAPHQSQQGSAHRASSRLS